MKNIDESLQAFEDYKSNLQKYIDEDISESDTRSKLIDEVLIKVLGWSEFDIRREGHSESGYFDYKVSIPGFVFLIEAKRQFKEFILPANHKRVSLKVLLKDNNEVINQIRNYALDESIQYGVITNGYQYILCKLFNTDGKPWKDNTCLVFKSIHDIDARFVDFFNNLSKTGIIANGGFSFDLPINDISGKTILSTLLEKDKELIRNEFSGTLAPLIDQIFGEMFAEERNDDIDFIRSCFVENDETKKNKSEIERLFLDEAPAFHNAIPIVNTKNLQKAIVNEIKGTNITIKNSNPPKPIVIIGSKGAGKSTFINHLFKHSNKSDDFEHQLIIYVDFRKYYEHLSQFESEKVATRIIESIYEKYESMSLHSKAVLKRIYYKQIKHNDENIWEWDKQHNQADYNRKLSDFFAESLKKPFDHLTLLSHYLIRERRKRLVIIIDNADQFNDKIQESLFLFSQSLTKSALCGTVISLREGYYRKWQNHPPFDAYEYNIYHITAPPYGEVLQKRLDYAIQQIKTKPKHYLLDIGYGKPVQLTPEYVILLLESLKNSLFEIENSSLLDFLKHTTTPNIREGLRLFKTFINSGHSKLTDYIERQRDRPKDQQPHQLIPLHEFIKAIALQNRHYYNSESSIIYNLFIPPADSKDHFIKLYILKETADIIEKRSYTEKQVRNVTIIEKFTALGYKLNDINYAIHNLIKAALLDTDEQLSDIEWTDLPQTYNLTLTEKGFYYIKILLYKFHYYDLIFQDTPVFDPVHFTILQEAFPPSSNSGNRNLEMRKDFSLKFIEYLEEMESKQGSSTVAVFGSLISKIKIEIEKTFSEWNTMPGIRPFLKPINK